MSQANRLKLKKHREIQSKKKYKHGEIQRSGSERRGYKVRYWNQKTGSWQATKPAPLVRKVEVKKEKPLTRAEKLKQGMATWNTKKGNEAYGAKLEDSKIVKKNTGNNKNVSVEENKENKQNNKEEVTPKTENKNTGGGETKTVDKPKGNGTTNGTPESKTEKKNEKLKIKKGSARNWIKGAKGKMYRRGTPMAKRAEERERKRKALAAKGYMKNR